MVATHFLGRPNFGVHIFLGSTIVVGKKGTNAKGQIGKRGKEKTGEKGKSGKRVKWKRRTLERAQGLKS